MSKVQTHTIAGQTASGKLGSIFPTSQQPAYASRFSSVLENLAESGASAAPFLSVPAVSNGQVALGRNLPTPVAIQTPAPQSADMTLLFVARLPNAPASGNGNVGVMGATFYNSTSLNAWNGLMFGLGSGLASLYVCNDVNGTLSTQYGGAALTAAQAQAWGLYAARISSSGGTGIMATIQALTAGTEQVQNWAGTLYSKTGETPTVMLGADYIPVFGTGQSVEIKRAFIWNTTLTDAEVDAMAALIRADLASETITV
ncbi:hypothetical protein [Gluconobacter oxydans]|uniref:hypothetical protein n=1 Tax=Gluconobacter oxydans TaxID=442 RepID=UPI00062C60A0|nr:hypothetical protein [Gluconobacter oxydans]